MIKLCAFSDEASDSLEGQIAALLRNNIKFIELRSVGGMNVKDFTNEQAETYAKSRIYSGAIRYEFSVFITLIVRAKKCLKIFAVW